MNKEFPTFQDNTAAKSKRTPRLLEIVKRHFDSEYFQVDQSRAHQFLYEQDRSETKSQANLQIPIGKHDWIQYQGDIKGGVSDRPISSYQTMLFPDIFTDPVRSKKGSFSIEKFLCEAELQDSPQPEFGGFQEVFKPGNVVLDIASGEAVADMQLALKFPDTTIIGTDILYKDKKRVYPNRSGLQLTHADWRELQTIPDRSVDAILSVQGVTMWGLPGSAHIPDVSVEDGLKIVEALNRVSKPGTIIRFDRKNKFLCLHIGNDWQISSKEDVFIAQRKKL